MYIKVNEIKERIKNELTGGYFYTDNCRVNYSGIAGWFIKFYRPDGVMDTKIITERKAEKLIAESLEGQASRE